LPPPRDKLLGNTFCKEFLSGLISPGGIGKTSVRLLQAVAVSCGRTDANGIGISGERVYKRSKVLILCLEDSEKELNRRLWALALHYGILPEELDGWLYVDTPIGLKLATINNKKQRISGGLEQAVRDAIAKYQLDLVIFDPLADAHELDENAAGDMNYVAGLLTRMAIELTIAIDSPHHARKGASSPGDPDAIRGSTAIPAKSRIVYSLTAMSVKEAQGFGLNPEDRHLYLRVDRSKVNIAPARETQWFKLMSVDLGNATENNPYSDYVQAAEPWSPPATWQGMEPDTVEAILLGIDEGMPNGQRYGNHHNASEDRQAWRLVRRFCPEKDESACQEIIKTWMREGTLYADNYFDPIERKRRKCLYRKGGEAKPSDFHQATEDE